MEKAEAGSRLASPSELWAVLAGAILAGAMLAGLAGCGVLRPPAAPEAVRPDTTLTAQVALARFEAAAAVGVVPGGTVYVADAGRDVIVRLWPEGERAEGRVQGREEVLGGPGGAAGQFDGPSDVDPTNGLVIVVADAGNGRIQRFSEAFRHIETLPVGRGYAAAGEEPTRPVYDNRADETNDFGGGRPVAVREPEGEATYALDAAEGHVLKWEDQRRTVRVIGGFDSGDAGALLDPVDLAIGPGGLLYVADAGRGAVLVYDRFGSYLTARPVREAMRAVATGPGGRLYVAQPRSLLVYGAEGRLLRRVRLRLPAEAAAGGVVDVAPSGEHLFVLTRSALFRVARP